MSEGIFVVTVPQLGVNDLVAIVVEWYVSDEGTVSAGQPLCTLETTKATFDVEAEAAGHVVHLVDADSEVGVSQPIALISSSLETLKAEKGQYVSQVRTERSTQGAAGGPVKATQKAKGLAQRLGVDLTEVLTEGIIRKQDVIQHYERTRVPYRHALSELSWDATRRPVVIYGAGKGAVTVKECLDFQQVYEVVCFIDDNPEHPLSLCELPVYHSSLLPDIISLGVRALACAIGNADVRLRILRQCEEMEVDLINVVHPQAYIAPTVRMGKGNYVKAGVVIDTNTEVGNCCIIDNGAIIPHDNVIGDGCHIAPGVAMGGYVVVGERAIIGIGTSVSASVQIGKAAIVSVGSAVTKNVPEFAVVEGVPAKVIGTRSRGKNGN